MELWVRFEFSASHRLDRYDGPCNRLHGHNYTLEVAVRGPVDGPSGMVMDFAALERIVRSEALLLVDHRHLNDVLDYPTAENIARFLWQKLQPHVTGLAEIKLFEVPGYWVIYRGEDER